MDITSQELKTMKAKQLRRIIREAITEVLAEGANDMYTLRNPAQATTGAPTLINPDDTTEKTPKFMSMYKKVSEGDIEEMARIAKGFRLADPEFDASQYANKRVSGTSLADIINYFRENPGAEKSQLQAQFNFVRPQIANAVVNALLDAGVLVKLGAGGEVEATPAPGEEQPEPVTGPEALFIGSGDPLAQYFDGEPNTDGEEDFNAEEEPTVGDASGQPVSAASMSDEDYEAFMEYTKLKDRLDATKSNLIKMKRRKGGTAGDISDKPSTEEMRLRDLKKSLEDRVNALVAGSDYLKKKVAAASGKEEEPIETPEEDETVAEGLDEYTIRKIQFYAGIIK